VTPFYFGSSARRLFGCYHPPLTTGKSLGIVICNPLGTEYFYAHKTVRFLAVKLSEQGIHVLRFDYYGTGDSDGGAPESHTETEDCADDVAVALDELREMSEAAKVGLVGIRAGAAVAARASTTNGAIAPLVLWDPLVHRNDRKPDQSSNHSPRRSAPNVHRILLVATCDDASAYEPVVATLTNDGDAPALVHAPAAPFWSDAGPGQGGLPVAAVEETVKWLTT